MPMSSCECADGERGEELTGEVRGKMTGFDGTRGKVMASWFGPPRNPIGVHEKHGEQVQTLDIKTALSGNRCFRLLDTAFWSFRVVDAFDLIRRLR